MQDRTIAVSDPLPMPRPTLEPPDLARAFWCGLLPQAVGVCGVWCMYVCVLAPGLPQNTVDIAEGRATWQGIARFFLTVGRPVVLITSTAVLLMTGLGLTLLAPSHRRSTLLFALGALPTLAMAIWCTFLGLVLPQGVRSYQSPIELSGWTYLPLLIWVVCAGSTVWLLLDRADHSTTASGAVTSAVYAQLLALAVAIGAPSGRPTFHELGMRYPESANILLGVWPSALAVLVCAAAQWAILLRAGRFAAAAGTWLAFLISCLTILASDLHLALWTRPFGK